MIQGRNTEREPGDTQGIWGSGESMKVCDNMLMEDSNDSGMQKEVGNLKTNKEEAKIMRSTLVARMPCQPRKKEARAAPKA